MFIVAVIVSFIPLTALFIWLRNRLNQDDAYRALCNDAFKRGALCILPVMLFSAVSHILLRLTGFHNTHPLLYQALYTFIVLALSEEVAKYFALKKVLKETEYPYSWLDVTAFMTIVGIGFGLLEAVIYAIGASVPVVLVRGICLPHAGYGFIVGYYYGKGRKNGNSAQKWLGFALAWLMHGLYDFSLSEEFIAVNDNLVFIPLLLAFMDIILVIILVVFAKKARKQTVYTEPLPEEI
ncbi:MAG TPA: hypothetical protein DHW39_05940 [Erysipelotrichaceae bacterium]|nr:hypothetical protein [Erysipelotrichaceae bacterium]